ncbi:MAG TPA: CvpA family protein [Verrucomicrobiae bacterium]
MSFSQLPVNLFDLALLAVLAVGVWSGRKHGMSEELMSLVKWLAIVFGCALLYQPVGTWLAQSSPFSLLFSFMLVYVAGALVILALFGIFKHQLGGKLIGSDIFGRSEYYLGMGSGLVRFACILLAALAVLNARAFSREEVVAMQRFQNDVYGSNFFPTWHTAQEVVFEKSLTGAWIKDNLAFLLIKPTKPENKQYHQKEAQLP